MADTMSSGDDNGERNPFAPPPADAPDRPWQPRPAQQPHRHQPSDGSGDGSGSDSGDGQDDDTRVPPPHPWSPGYRGGWSEPQQPRFDPTDPVQRRARYALSAGMAGLFCAITSMPYVALLLGALALYWGVSALRSGGATAAPAATGGSGPSGSPAAGPTANPHALGTARIAGWTQPQPQSARPQLPAALGGLLTGGVALLFTLSLFGAQLYYHDYVTCRRDALTTEAAANCADLAPGMVVELLGPADG